MNSIVIVLSLVECTLENNNHTNMEIHFKKKENEKSNKNKMKNSKCNLISII